jgi:hypothetical protein
VKEMKKTTLKNLTEKEIQEGRAFLEIGWAPRLKDKDLRKIIAVNRESWVVKTGDGDPYYSRTWYCTPDTTVYVGK